MLANIPNLFHYDSSKSSRVKCDPSHNGLGACLEQEIEPGVWAPTAFASRFLNNAETKYSTNELELLAIVWACEHFRTYLLGNRFQVLTDHKAIISALSENYNNKSYQSRLSRWADRLLPFDLVTKLDAAHSVSLIIKNGASEIKSAGDVVLEVLTGTCFTPLLQREHENCMSS